VVVLKVFSRYRYTLRGGYKFLRISMAEFKLNAAYELVVVTNVCARCSLWLSMAVKSEAGPVVPRECFARG
jgi:hypothetical protein